MFKRNAMKKQPAPLARKHTVYVVDDHPLIRDSLQQLIDSEPDLQVCGQAESYDEAKQGIEKLQPELAIVDIGLKDLSGIDLMREIKFRSPGTRILVLSMFEESLYAPKCFKAGARGYVMKSAPPATVLNGLRTLLEGNIAVSPNLAQYVLRSVVGDEEPACKPVPELLSARELEVFRMLGRGISSVDIAAKMRLSRKTVQTYREHIKRKLGLRNATDLVHHATHWVEAENGPVKRP